MGCTDREGQGWHFNGIALSGAARQRCGMLECDLGHASWPVLQVTKHRHPMTIVSELFQEATERRSPPANTRTDSMRRNIPGVIGLVACLLSIVALLGLIANGYSLKTFSGAFAIQLTIAVAIVGMFFAWREGARIISIMREDYLKRSFPNQPWLWRLDWSRRVSVAPKSTQHYTAAVAAAWNLGITPLAVACTSSAAKSSPSFVLSVAAILVGAALFFYALYRIWFTARLDNPELRIHTNPARPGQAFECTLGVPGFGEGIRWSSELVCLCSRVESLRSGSRYTTRTVVTEVWKQTFVPLVARSLRGAALALKFVIGRHAPATGYFHGGNWRWVVRVQGRNKAGVVRFSREYEVPMHREVLSETAESAGRLDTGAFISGAGWRGKIDVPTMLNALKESGIRFSKGGVIYPNELWDQEPLVRLHATINKVCLGIFCSAVVGATLVMLVAPWYWSAPFVLLAIAAGVGYGIAFYVRHHRYAVIFHTVGVTRRNWLLSRQWDTTVPWSKIQSVVWKSSAGLAGSIPEGESFRQLVINPDDRKTRLVLSPALANSVAAEALVRLLRTATRRGTSG